MRATIVESSADATRCHEHRGEPSDLVERVVDQMSAPLGSPWNALDYGKNDGVRVMYAR